MTSQVNLSPWLSFPFHPHHHVQFVPFRDYISSTGGNVGLSQARLAKDVLAEVPDQVLGFMKARGITPDKLPKPSHLSQGQVPSAPPI